MDGLPQADITEKILELDVHLAATKLSVALLINYGKKGIYYLRRSSRSALIRDTNADVRGRRVCRPALEHGTVL